MRGLRFVRGLVTILLLAALTPIVAQAQVTPTITNPLDLITAVEQRDQNGDGQPDVTIIQLDYITDNDLVVVYDGGGDMRAGTTWQETTDFENDTWLFDIGGDNTVQLVLQFQRVDDKLRALIFNDLNKDGKIDVQIENGRITISEARFPSIVAEVTGDWWLPSGGLNWNIAFYTDGAGLTLIDQTEFSARFTDVWQPFLRLDGQPDTVLQFYDQDEDGIPDSGLWRLLAETPSDMGSVRVWGWSNNGGFETPPHPDFLFWPYLVTVRGGRFVSGSFANPAEIFSSVTVANYFTAPPSIEVAWLNGLVSPVLFRGYPIEEGYHLHGFQYFEPNRVNYTNFEIAQNYYDLAEDQDSFPEMHIRHRYFEAQDILGWGVPADLNEIRWSWNQTNRSGLVFNYKLGLAGRHHIDEQTTIGDFAYHAVPYDEMPEWVISRPWDIVTFVSIEHENYISSEGIYTWGPIESLIRDEPSVASRYLSGQLSVNIAEAFTTIDVGQRGEYTDYLNDIPWLYFSPIDRKLHLVNADSCLWHVAEGVEIRCQNLNGDDYLDRWQYYQDGQLRRELIQWGDLFILHIDDVVVFKRAEVPPEVFRALPPTDHETWTQLGAQLEAHERSFEPGDFEAMLNQFEGETSVIQGATFTDFRLTEQGFRFKLQLNETFEETLSPLFPSIAAYDTNNLVGEMRDGVFVVSPATPPDISMNLTVSEQPPDVFSGTTRLKVTIALENRGLEDLNDVTIELYVQPSDGTVRDRVWLGLASIDLLGSNSEDYDVYWVPRRTGTWNVVARLTQRDVNTVVREIRESVEAADIVSLVDAQVSYEFNNAPTVSRYQYLVLNGEQPLSGVPLVVLLLALAVSAVALFGLVFVLARKTQSDN
jgi:hypothetical protein